MIDSETRNNFFTSIKDDSVDKGIGVLSEKNLHSVLKKFFEPDSEKREVSVGQYVADICRNDDIVEIQTQGFNRLRGKLSYFLECKNVTVVYPIPHVKWLCWIDKETGEVSKKRKSPKVGNIYDSLFELYKIKMFLSNSRLKLCFIFIDIMEYRYLDGWSSDKKKGSSRCERIPVDIYDEIYINKKSDYLLFVPHDIGNDFTVKEFSTLASIPVKRAQLAVNILYSLGVISRTGKKGRCYTYSIV